MNTPRENIDFSEAPKCAVGPSKICEGQGLFAIEQIQEGEVVIDYNTNSKNWEKVEFGDIPKIFKEFCWWIGIDKKYCLLANKDSAFMRANHSKTPNLLWIPDKKIHVANQVIQPGTELTYDYQLEIASPEIKENPPIWA